MDELTLRERLSLYTHARVALKRSGHSISTSESLDFEWAHAQAQMAIYTPANFDQIASELKQNGIDTLQVKSQAEDRPTYLLRPDLGRLLHPEDAAQLAIDAPPKPSDVAIVLADGLSATAIHSHGVRIAHKLHTRLQHLGYTLTPIVLARQARVALADPIGMSLKAKLSIILIGERPGLSSSDSLGAYLTFDPKPNTTDAERNCVSNIHTHGLSDESALRSIVFLAQTALSRQLSGINLKDESHGDMLEL